MIQKLLKSRFLNRFNVIQRFDRTFFSRSPRQILTSILFLGFLAFSQSDYGQSVASASDLIYGPEWTFTNDEFLNLSSFSDDNQVVMKNIFIRFQSYCGNGGQCRFEKESTFVGKVIYNDGLIITITRDPGVVELQATPLSMAQWNSRKNEIQKDIFDQLAMENLVPHLREGAGHNNIGLLYFKDKPMLLRNFIVDFYNNPGVGIVLNSLVDNAAYAQALDQMDLSRRKAFLKALAKLDEIKNFTIVDVLKTLGLALNGKYIALGVRDIFPNSNWPHALSPSSRLEVRTLRPQASMEDYAKVNEIFDARIHYLKSIKNPIPLSPIMPTTDGYVALGQYADYLEDAGLKFNNYKSLMPESWKELPFENFIRSIKPSANAMACQKLF